MKVFAVKRGFSIDELFGGARKKNGGVVAVNYCHADDLPATWTGRGHQPRWLVAKLKNGVELEKFLVK